MATTEQGAMPALSRKQLALLGALHRHPPGWYSHDTLADDASHIMPDMAEDCRQNLRHHCGNLVREGLADDRDHPDDTRRKQYRITDAGERVINSITGYLESRRADDVREVRP